MNPTVHFCLTNNREDAQVFREHEMTFDKFCSMFREHLITEDKNTKMLVPWVFGDRWGRRNEENTIGASMICLDFDDDSGWTLSEAKEVFRKYVHFGYTSFSHQKNGKDRFRIVLPLKEFAPKVEIEKRRRAIYKMYEGVDTSCLSISRAFNVPSCPQERKHLAEAWVNDGELLDISTFEAEPDFVPAATNAVRPTLDDDKRQWILDALKETFIGHEPTWRKIGLAMCAEGFTYQDFVYVSVGGLMNQKTEKDCSEKWKVAERSVQRGNVKVNLGTIINILKEHGKEYSTVPRDSNDDVMIKKVAEWKAKRKDETNTKPVERPITLAKPKKKAKKYKVSREVLDMFFADGEPEVPYDRDRRGKLTAKLCVGKQYNHMLMFAFEGYGKSYLAYLEAKRGTKVVMASLSNAQVNDQYESFKQAHPELRCQMIPGRQWSLKKLYGIDAVMKDEAHPYDYGDIHPERTKALIKDQLKLKTKEEVEEVWERCGADDPDFAQHDIIFTTFARLQSWGIRQRRDQASPLNAKVIVPPGTIVIIDDPSTEMVSPIKPYDEKWAHLVVSDNPTTEEVEQQIADVRAEAAIEKKDGEEENKPVPIRLRVMEVKGLYNKTRKYFIRPDELKFGYGLFKTKIVFTTTEAVTAELIKKLYPNVYVPELMPPGPMKAGHVTMIRTKLARSKLDGLIPCLVHRIKKKHPAIHLLADGIGSEYNLVNSRGMNQFIDSDTIVKCSFPSMYKVLPIMDALGWEDTEDTRAAVGKILALDALQQAIGRNCGYRATDRDVTLRKQCIVVADPQLYDAFTSNPVMRYYVEKKIDKPERHCVYDDPINDDLLQSVCWMVAHFRVYLEKGFGRWQAFEDDFKSVIASTQLAASKLKFKKRVFIALKTLIEEKESSETLKKRLSKWFEEWGGDLILGQNEEVNLLEV